MEKIGLSVLRTEFLYPLNKDLNGLAIVQETHHARIIFSDRYDKPFPCSTHFRSRLHVEPLTF